jgi:hypothetical protein
MSVFMVIRNHGCASGQRDNNGCYFWDYSEREDPNDTEVIGQVIFDKDLRSERLLQNISDEDNHGSY